MARNPFRSEAEAYRFLLLTVGYFALIVAAAAIQTLRRGRYRHFTCPCSSPA